jgi:ATP-dependent exoDNAse (exonuclease V) alpha subunit
MKLILKNKLYPQQQEAYKAIMNFINSDEVVFTLSGVAGTGKTHLIKHVVTGLPLSYCPTAPVHKAVRVIENVLNRRGKTVQSLLGLRPNLDLANFSISNPQFDPKGTEYIKNYNLIIIDEASMINNDTFDYLKTKAKEYKTKLLFLGDPLQLPPVKKEEDFENKPVELSKVFSNYDSYFELTEIIRQEESNPILSIVPLIRDDIKNETKNAISYLLNKQRDVVEGLGFEVYGEQEFNEILLKYLKDNSTHLDKVKVIAYTNAAVNSNNKFIRNSIIENNKDILSKDDILTAYNTIVDEFNTPIIINSEDYFIEEIRKYRNEFDIDTFCVNLRAVIDNRITLTLQVVDHNSEKFINYYNILCTLHYQALTASKEIRKKQWVKYFKFKDDHLTMVTFNLKAANRNATVKKDLDYGYCITTHKSQGSTYKDVFIDLKNIIAYQQKTGKYVMRRDKNIMNRLLYVALTRAQNKVILKY